MDDAELIAAMRARAGLMNGRAEALRRQAKAVKSGARRSEMERIARGIDFRAGELRRVASSIETLETFDV